MAIIGYYGGSFNPIHFGHICLALEFIEARCVDQVWFCPAHKNPLKNNEMPVDGRHRLAMLQLALNDVPHFRVVDSELKRPPPSYTIDTLLELMNQNPEHSFRIILGDDVLDGFLDWKQPEEIVKLTPPLVGMRHSRDIPAWGRQHPIILKILEAGMKKTRILEISSTEIRNRIRRGLYIKHLVPAPVVNYIYENGLYL